MQTIKLYDSSINAVKGQPNPQSLVGNMRSVDLQDIMLMIANRELDEASQLLTDAGIAVQRFNENGSTKIVFKFDNREYTLISNLESEDVNGVGAVKAPSANSPSQSTTVVNMDDDSFTKEEIHKLGFVSEKDLEKYFDYKNGIYTLKSGLVVEGKSINNTQELMDLLGMISLDDYIEKIYGCWSATVFSDTSNIFPESYFLQFKDGLKSLDYYLKEWSGKFDWNNSLYTRSVLNEGYYVDCLFQEGYITEEDFPTDSYD